MTNLSHFTRFTNCSYFHISHISHILHILHNLKILHILHILQIIDISQFLHIFALYICRRFGRFHTHFTDLFRYLPILQIYTSNTLYIDRLVRWPLARSASQVSLSCHKLLLVAATAFAATKGTICDCSSSVTFNNNTHLCGDFLSRNLCYKVFERL